jgi:uncharacterized protein
MTAPVSRPPLINRTTSIALFLAVSFVWTWALELIGRARLTGKPTLDALGPWLLVASFGPTVGAVVAAISEHGPGGVRTLASRFGPLRQNWRVWLYASYVLVPAALIALLVFSPSHVGDALGEGALLAFVPLVGLFSIVGGPLGEEFGWRGLLLPAALRRTNPLAAAVGVGVVWALWHAPLWTFSDFTVGMGAATFVPLYVVSLIAMSVVMTVLHLRSSGSVFFAMLAHGVFNSVLLPFDSVHDKGFLSTATAWPFTIATVATAVVVTLRNGHLLRDQQQ